MLKQYKDFKELQSEIREEFSPLLRISEVRNIIGCSWDFVVELVQDSELDAVDIRGMTVERDKVSEDSRGLRILPSSLRDFLDRNTIK